MISINNISLSFGGVALFENINFHINSNDRIGLVGRNGSGKTTLLKIISSTLTPSSGVVQIPSDIVVGYLPQVMEHDKSKLVMEGAKEAFSHLTELEKRVRSINIELSKREDYESDDYNNLLVKLDHFTERLSLATSQNIDAKAERVLIGLGFKREEFNRKIEELSEGWAMRVELAKVLLREPDILLLDEPTNHLDIESIKWLEEFLASYKGALVLISHDRRFLDSVTNRTVEIVLGKIYDYKVSYTKYRELRRERMEQQRAAYENQQRMIEKSEEFIDRFRYKATKSNQVQSRIKQLEKVERIEIEEEDNSILKIKFPPAPRSGRVVVEVKDLSLSFGEKEIFREVNLTIERGEKIALLGRNGEGKTTFLRVLTGELSPNRGSITLGHNVNLGYYAQNQEELLDKNDTLLETLDRVAVGDVRTRLRDILGAFLFRGDETEKKVEVLSGGERARLAMAKIMLKPYNLLLLDEPTNHMDILSREVLKKALLTYEGTLIVVSHDRDFLDGLVDKAYEFNRGGVKEHFGGVKEFLERKNILEDELPNSSSSAPAIKQSKAFVYKQEREVKREERRREIRIERCEREIEELERALAEIEKRLAENDIGVSLPESIESYERVREELNKKMDEWEMLHN